MAILFALVARRGLQPETLAEFSTKQGNFRQIAHQLISVLAAQDDSVLDRKKTYTHGAFTFNYVLYEDLILLCMAERAASGRTTLPFRFLKALLTKILTQRKSAGREHGLQGMAASSGLSLDSPWMLRSWMEQLMGYDKNALLMATLGAGYGIGGGGGSSGSGGGRVVSGRVVSGRVVSGRVVSGRVVNGSNRSVSSSGRAVRSKADRALDELFAGDDDESSSEDEPLGGADGGADSGDSTGSKAQTAGGDGFETYDDGSGSGNGNGNVGERGSGMAGGHSQEPRVGVVLPSYAEDMVGVAEGADSLASAVDAETWQQLTGSLAVAEAADEFLNAMLQHGHALTELHLASGEPVTISQAFKDAVRERFRVNGEVISGSDPLAVLHAVEATLQCVVHHSSARAGLAQTVLCVASRTISGFDSYARIMELFARPGVMITPSHAKPAPIEVVVSGVGEQCEVIVTSANNYCIMDEEALMNAPASGGGVSAEEDGDGAGPGTGGGTRGRVGGAAPVRSHGGH